MKSLVIIISLLLSGVAFSQKDSETIRIKTSAVCGSCEKRIEHDMKFEKGINSADLNLKSNVLVVKYDPGKTTPEKIRTALTKIGYNADDMPADEKAYRKLPKCCQKEGVCEHD